MLFIRKSTFDDVSLILFAKEWKHKSRKIVQKKIWCCGKSHNCKAKFFVHTKPNHQSWHPKQVRANFVKELWINFVWGCLIEVKYTWKILDYSYCPRFWFLSCLLKKRLFCKFSFFFNFLKQPRKTPVRIKNFIFFCLANLGCRRRWLKNIFKISAEGSRVSP